MFGFQCSLISCALTKIVFAPKSRLHKPHYSPLQSRYNPLEKPSSLKSYSFTPNRKFTSSILIMAAKIYPPSYDNLSTLHTITYPRTIR